ncbi:hypothetical protein CC1G_15282 [Coprinopsis cinerea okayama7|uniref:Uncharacterized protein n=1 Tax=Coprinopsis cinerea (strain Okayama-7 / 130 / ATCC MYA-4618 / FGSC 9003) TaxID=240176 RepID=D6RQ75_COPC7|nr:hypothetical protein CC1G_15282 [Coprinopsis cinerea okayama7\|eukprot:XP_002910375.1 hypothetical protein CC1G_15282 [Coprinopsis cinerea okayama7\
MQLILMIGGWVEEATSVQPVSREPLDGERRGKSTRTRDAPAGRRASAFPRTLQVRRALQSPLRVALDASRKRPQR